MASSQTNKRFASQPVNWTVLANTPDVDAIRCLVEALTTADKTVALDIEHQLVKTGALALPFVLEGLAADNLMQQSTCAMVLLRWQAVDALQLWRDTHPQHQWIADTLLTLMPQSAEASPAKPQLAIVS